MNYIKSIRMKSNEQQLKDDLEAMSRLHNRIIQNPQVIMSCGTSLFSVPFVGFIQNKQDEYKALDNFNKKHQRRRLNFLNKNNNEK